MGYKFNPFIGSLDTVDSPDGVFESLEVDGDITLDDGGTYTTTLQTITPTANRTVSIPDATGTVALVAGSSGQLVYNNAGANAGVSSSAVGATGNISLSLNGAASTPPLAFTGTWFTGGTGTTTKPQLLIEPTGTTSTAWSTSGTGLGVNAASGFAGNLLDLQVNGTRALALSYDTSNTAALIGSGPTVLRYTLSNGSWNPLVVRTEGIVTGSNGYYSWTSTSNNPLGVQDLYLFRDAAGTLAQRNGTNAQTYRLYNTYTDASNYSRFSTSFSGNNVILNLERAGTGSFGDIVFAVGGINSAAIINSPGRSIRIPNGGDYGWSSDNSATGVSDTGLVRSAASVVKVTNGSTGDGTLLAQHRLAGTAPATASSSGTAGDIRYDADYIYVCTATNTWKRAALATW
jgi:hypothetical protein